MADKYISQITPLGSSTTYLLKDKKAIENITRSGTTFTATRRDGTTFTFTQQDNDSITGVKGNAETNYRTGNVNLTPTNILGTGTTAQFWRGDNIWSNTIKQTANETLGIDTNLKIGTARKDLNFDITNGSGTGINDGYAGGITWGSGTSAYAGIYYQTSGSYGSRLHFATTSSYANGAYTRMLITHDGKIGIGTLTPSTALHVIGDITASGLTASQAVSTDANKKLVSSNLTAASPSASGSGIEYIATISQNAVGKITATKSTVRDASASQSGVVSTGTQTFAGNKTFNGIIDINNTTRINREEHPSDAFSTLVGITPLNIFGLKNGYPVYTDPDFSTGTNSVGVYNNTSGGNVVHTRQLYSTANILHPGTSSGYVITIQTKGAASPGVGGFVQSISSRANAVFVQIFRALIPEGRKVITASNSMGTSYTDKWLTSQEGTGKWEWYARIVHCGATGTFSSGGHIYLNGEAGTASAPVTWHLAFCNVYDITKGQYDGLRVREADNADIATKAAALSPAGTTAQFWRGDNTWSNELSGGQLKITNYSNTVTIGSGNANYMHFSNSADIPFYFNKSIWVDGDLYPYGTTNTRSLGTSSKRWKSLLIGTADSYGNGEQPIYWNAGVPKATTYHLKAHIEDGSANCLAYYSAARTIDYVPKITYFTYPSTDTTNGPVSGSSSGLIITETSNGGNAGLKSGNEALVSYGDSGPQIRFKSSDTGILLYHHYDTASDGGAGSFHFLNSSGVATAIAGGFTSYANSANKTGFRLRHKTNNVSYGFMRIATIGTASAVGNGELTLGNATAEGTDGNARGSIYLYAANTHWTGILAQGNGDRTFYLPNYAGNGYFIHAGSNDAVGSTGQPIYAAANGRIASIDWHIGNKDVGEHNANNIKYNMIGYYTSNGPAKETSYGFQSTDGAIYAQGFSTAWVGQIAQDYRTGGLAVRGLNNGTWTSWLQIPTMTQETYPALLNAKGSNGWIKIGTANTSYGLLPSQAGNAGSGHNYLGTSSWYWKYAYIDEIHGSLTGNAATATAANITSTDNAIVRFNGTAGAFQNSKAFVNDNGSITAGTWTANTAGSAEIDVTAESGAGIIYLYSAKAITGNRGIWLKNASGATSSGLLVANQDNNINIHAPMATNLTVATSNTYNLGASGARWKAAFIGTADSYGSATNPIYWSNGVPVATNTFLTTELVHYCNEAAATLYYVTTSITVSTSANCWIYGTITGTKGTGSSAGMDVRFQVYWNKSTFSAVYYQDSTNAISEMTFYTDSSKKVYFSFACTQYSRARITILTNNAVGNANYATAISTTAPATFSITKTATKIASTSAVKTALMPNNSTPHYVLGVTGTTADSNASIVKAYRTATAQVYFRGDTGVLMGAAWNDYAEYRQAKNNIEIEPGRVVKEVGDETLELTTERLQRGCSIVSNTFGISIGESETNKLPLAVAGRVLAYPYESKEEFKNHIGWPVCSGPNGTVSIMTEEEEMKYPSRIIGTISAVPNYEVWYGGADVIVDGRIWIKVR